MNTNSLKNLKPFPPGNKMGSSIVKLPPELRAARRENMSALIRLIHQYVGLTREQAEQRIGGPDALQLEEMVQGQITKAATGDSNAFKFLIEVMCGKIPESDEERTSDSMTNEEKIELMKKALAVMEAQVGSIPSGSSP